MARIVRHTRTITQDLRPPWQYVLLGMGLLGALEVGGVLIWWLLAHWNF
jgi:hypothetical protein